MTRTTVLVSIAAALVVVGLALLFSFVTPALHAGGGYGGGGG